MRKMSLADAKARISELVDQAEHHGQRVVILRHGKPAAAIVPVDVALPKRKSRPRMTQAQVEQSVRAYIAEFSASEPESSAVDDLLAGRR
jgi:prevent-host-death family protein